MQGGQKKDKIGKESGTVGRHFEKGYCNQEVDVVKALHCPKIDATVHK